MPSPTLLTEELYDTLELGVIVSIPPKEQYEFKFDSPFPGYKSFAYISFYTIDEERLEFKILDLADNSFVHEESFQADYLAKVHFRRKQDFIFVLTNPNPNRRVRVMCEFHCVDCKDTKARGEAQALKGSLTRRRLRADRAGAGDAEIPAQNREKGPEVPPPAAHTARAAQEVPREDLLARFARNRLRRGDQHFPNRLHQKPDHFEAHLTVFLVSTPALLEVAELPPEHLRLVRLHHEAVALQQVLGPDGAGPAVLGLQLARLLDDLADEDLAWSDPPRVAMICALLSEMMMSYLF